MEWRAKEDITLKVKTITPEVIYQAIDKIAIKSNHKSAIKLTTNEAIGFWLLMFATRGFYTDITALTSHNLDYNFHQELSTSKKILALRYHFKAIPIFTVMVDTRLAIQ